MSSRRGRMTVTGEHATIVFERALRHRPEHVWEAIATPEGLRAWLLCTEAKIEGRAGGRIELVSGPPRYRSTGTILRWEPPRVLEYEWKVAPVPEMPRGEDAIFRYELFPTDEGTRLIVTCRHITAATAGGFLPGLHVFLDRLEAQLDGAPPSDRPDDWLVAFAELRASGEYEEWELHAAAPGE